jgi:hypothetical protein
MTDKVILDPDIVLTTCVSCQLEEADVKPVIIKGLTRIWRFHPKRLDECKAEIATLLEQLPDAFQKSKGGKGSVLSKAGWDRNGREWTGMISLMERLYVLGLATKQVTTLKADGDPMFIVN